MSWLEARPHCGVLCPENAKDQQAIRVWQRLPVRLANPLGPRIVRGIPEPVTKSILTN